MHDPNCSRRDFNRLTLAAMGGAVAGCASGHGASPVAAADNPLLSEPHVCCGLNTCKGKGACKTAGNDCKGKNACAGQGKCASAKKHACAGHNTCKGQGGCGAHPGENACKGQGSCGVPLEKKAWAKARTNFEKAMKAAGKAYGPAPAECGK